MRKKQTLLRRDLIIDCYNRHKDNWDLIGASEIILSYTSDRHKNSFTVRRRDFARLVKMGKLPKDALPNHVTYFAGRELNRNKDTLNNHSKPKQIYGYEGD